MKGKIPPFEQTAFDGRPFGKDDRLWVVAHCLESERITPDDIPFQNKNNRIAAFVFGFLAVKPAVSPIKNAEKALTAFYNVVLEYVDAINAGNGKDGIPLVFQLAPSIPPLNDSQFSLEYLGKEISSATGWLQKAGFDPLRFLPDQIQHGVDLPLPGIHLAMICHALFRDKVCFHLFAFIHQREVLPFHFLRLVAPIYTNEIAFGFHQLFFFPKAFETPF